jgi:hypothetical protein
MIDVLYVRVIIRDSNDHKILILYRKIFLIFLSESKG